MHIHPRACTLVQSCNNPLTSAGTQPPPVWVQSGKSAFWKRILCHGTRQLLWWRCKDSGKCKTTLTWVDSVMELQKQCMWKSAEKMLWDVLALSWTLSQSLMLGHCYWGWDHKYLTFSSVTKHQLCLHQQNVFKSLKSLLREVILNDDMEINKNDLIMRGAYLHQAFNPNWHVQSLISLRKKANFPTLLKT